MTRKINFIFAVILPAILGLGLLVPSAGAEDGRKIRSKVNPVYPDLAKRINATGSVRLEIQIAPNGDVRAIKALGGHPLLIPAAEDAIRKWKYEPASETTTTVVEFRFSPTP